MATTARGQGARPAPFGWIAAEVVCAAVILIAVLALPWARYRIQGSSTVSLHAVGALAVALGAVAGLGLLVAMLQLQWRAVALDWLAILLGCAALAFSVATAAGRIAHANTTTNLAARPSFTASRIGSALGVLGAVGLLGTAPATLFLDPSGTREPAVDQPVPSEPQPPCWGRNSTVLT